MLISIEVNSTGLTSHFDPHRHATAVVTASALNFGMRIKAIAVYVFASLLDVQWLMGFLSFWHRGEVRMTRIHVLPWHVFLVLYTYGLAVVTAEIRHLEKLTFLQTKGVVFKRCS